MESSIASTLLTLIQMMCVIVVVAYLLTRSRFFSEFLDGHSTIKAQLILVAVFGILSVYGTFSNVEVAGAIINVRDLGPIVGGPVVGLGSALIGAGYRATLGGPTVVPCVIATLLAGFLGGIIWLLNKKQIVSIPVAVVFAVAIECLHMGLTLLIVRPYSVALQVVVSAGPPMIVANAIGVFIFILIVKNLQNEKKMRAERDTLMREMERKNTELSIAAEIQQSFLPETIPRVEGFDVAGKSIMAKEVGGDFFDVIPFEVIRMKPGRMGVLIADVSGKGIPAALFMALSRIVVRINATLFSEKPESAIHDANNLIAADSKAGMFVTLFYGILDHHRLTFTYVNAGHNPPVVWHPDGTFEELTSTGIAMGALADAEFTARTKSLTPGDVIVLYTDGITEANNEREEMYGEERLYAAIRGATGLPAAGIIAKILDDVKEFTGDYPQSDDITLMAIRVE